MNQNVSDIISYEWHVVDVDSQVVFKAFWLSDFAMMSMDGSVSFHDFTTNLVKDDSKAQLTVEVI